MSAHLYKSYPYKVLGRGNSLFEPVPTEQKHFIQTSVCLYKKVKVCKCVQKAALQGSGQGQHPPSVIPFKEMLGEGGAWQPTHKRP